MSKSARRPPLVGSVSKNLTFSELTNLVSLDAPAGARTRAGGSVALVKRVARFEAANEARDDQTRQRRFERGFLSLDRPDAEGDLHDYGDCGRGARRMLSDLDAPFREQVREARFQRALARLAGHPEL